MKLSALAFVLALAAVPPFAGAQQPPPVPPEQEAQWVEIRKIKDVYERAAETGNVDQIAPFLDPGFTAATVTGQNIAGVQGLKEYTAQIKRLIGPGGKYSLKGQYQPGIMFGDTAIAYGTTTEQVITGEKRVYNFSSLWTANLTKRDGSWKLLRVHVSMDPIRNPFVKAYNARTNELYGGGGLLLGLLIGWLLTKRVFRKKA